MKGACFFTEFRFFSEICAHNICKCGKLNVYIKLKRGGGAKHKENKAPYRNLYS